MMPCLECGTPGCEGRHAERRAEVLDLWDARAEAELVRDTATREPAMTKKPGHRLEVISARGGLLASCTCGTVHTHKSNGRQANVFPTYRRALISTVHQAHVESV